MAKLLSDTISHRSILSQIEGHEKTRVPHPRAHEAFDRGFHAYDTTWRVLLGKRRHKPVFGDALLANISLDKNVIFPRSVAMQHDPPPLFLHQSRLRGEASFRKLKRRVVKQGKGIHKEKERAKRPSATHLCFVKDNVAGPFWASETNKTRMAFCSSAFA